MKSIEEAILIACTFHKGQLDKDRLPVIYHPIFVMNSMELDDLDGRKVAILHDVIEDTDCTEQYLKAMGFADHIVEATEAITYMPGEKYLDYIKKVKENKIALRVKLKDIAHNMARSRFALARDVGDITKMKKAQGRIDKYTKALEILSDTFKEDLGRAEHGIIV